MRRFSAFFAVLLLLLALGTTVSAASAVTQLNSSTAVSNDGSCQVSLSVSLELDSAAGGLVFPIPGNAKNVALNGTLVRTEKSGEFRTVDLSQILGTAAGSHSFTVSYTLNGVLSDGEDENLVLTLPLLCGFLYPVEQMKFTVTLPEAAEEAPVFSSGYLLTEVGSQLSVKTEGSTVTGALTKPLKDRDTLHMTLQVPRTMFLQSQDNTFGLGVDGVLMLLCGVLAVLYWLLTMRCLPLKRVNTTEPPDGVCAGQLRSALIAQGPDLTMMVFTWAQLGYILIQLEPHGRVLLHKRMEMGNERSAFEVKTFRSLFGRRRLLDGTGSHYAGLCRKTAIRRPPVQDLFRSNSGNPWMVRLLAAAAGFFGAMTLARVLTEDALLAVPLTAAIALLGGLTAWLIHRLPKGLHLKDRDSLIVCAVSCVLWLLLGVLAGQVLMGVVMVMFQLLMGLAAAYGGRRTDLGKQTAGQILGLRRYLRTVPEEELQRIVRSNPEYFFSLAPYAMALGVGKTFAKRFGSTKLNSCPYLTTGMDGHLTAAEWHTLLQKAADILNANQKKNLLERILK